MDEWTQKRVDALKEYQYSNQAGLKRYTPTLEERIESYESALKSLGQVIEQYGWHHPVVSTRRAFHAFTRLLDTGETPRKKYDARSAN